MINSLNMETDYIAMLVVGVFCGALGLFTIGEAKKYRARKDAEKAAKMTKAHDE